jgi:histone deacetylase 11
MSALVKLLLIAIPLLIILYFLSSTIFPTTTTLLEKVVVPGERLHLVYSPNYDVNFFGLERLHPFDAQKWGKVAAELVKSGVVKSREQLYDPAYYFTEQEGEAIIEKYLSEGYKEDLKSPSKVAKIMEINPLAFLPISVVDEYLLKKMRLQTVGSVLATRLALQHGVAINIGGGFHHASVGNGTGFCAYPDLTIAVLEARHNKLLTEEDKILIVDLDAHQGNGHELDFINDKNVVIVDLFSHPNYPGLAPNHAITKRIDHASPLPAGTTSEQYLMHVRDALAKYEKDTFSLIVYNAGTDILKGDPLGMMSVTEEATVERDELVFTFAKRKAIPIVMMTSGGYTSQSFKVISKSLLNLHEKVYADSPAATASPTANTATTGEEIHNSN